MQTSATNKCVISPAHLALLTRWANADHTRKAVNILICRMAVEQVERLTFVAAGSETRILIQWRDSTSPPREWEPVPIDFGQIWRRLTFMASPPPPWWHRLPLWYWLWFQVTERIDRWFWRPLLQSDGRFEFICRNRPLEVSFKGTYEGRIELSMSASVGVWPVSH